MLAAPQSETEVAPLLGPHVVVALDDEAFTLAALRRSLRGEPYELRTAEDPLQVLRWVETRDVSLVISDQRMPDMEGADLLDVVRLRSPRTIGVILTAYPELLRMDPALRSWIRLVMLKPWDDGLLRATLRHLLAAREAGHPPSEERFDETESELGGEA